MNLKTPYNDWLSSIDLAKTRVIRFPSLIFLCGGEISTNSDRFKSCRDIFYRYISQNDSVFKKNVVLAEQIFRYFEHSTYQDLLHFERDLAELSSLIVLFSESPGSIAELGSFAVLRTIQDRMLVVLHQEDSYKESFIWQGPALYLKHLAEKNGKQDPISIYFWRKRASEDDFLSQDDFSDAKDLEETINKILDSAYKSVAWDKKQLGHIMLLMLDLLQVVQIATIDEITNFLNFLGVEKNRRTVGQHLSLLLSLGFAVRKPYGHNVYYLSTTHRSWLSWTFKSTAKIRDIDRWKDLFVEHYSSYEIQKSRALRSYLKSEGLIGD